MLVEMDCIYIELFKYYQPFKVQHATLYDIFIHTHTHIYNHIFNFCLPFIHAQFRIPFDLTYISLDCGRKLEHPEENCAN